MNRIDNIIDESINKVITEEFMNEGLGDIAKLIKGFLKHNKHKHKKHDKDDDDKDKKKKERKKIRKLSNGRERFYDYDDYERSNGKTSAGDSSTIRSTIDTEKTNIAAVARDLFPDHTEEGAQSQLRKILNGERPMTKKIASKIEKMISKGQIAVK
jgi:hypothetical protein